MEPNSTLEEDYEIAQANQRKHRGLNFVGSLVVFPLLWTICIAALGFVLGLTYEVAKLGWSGAAWLVRQALP